MSDGKNVPPFRHFPDQQILIEFPTRNPIQDNSCVGSGYNIEESIYRPAVGLVCRYQSKCGLVITGADIYEPEGLQT